MSETSLRSVDQTWVNWVYALKTLCLHEACLGVYHACSRNCNLKHQGCITCTCLMLTFFQDSSTQTWLTASQTRTHALRVVVYVYNLHYPYEAHLILNVARICCCEPSVDFHAILGAQTTSMILQPKACSSTWHASKFAAILVYIMTFVSLAHLKWSQWLSTFYCIMLKHMDPS